MVFQASTTLKNVGYTQSKVDYSLFTKAMNDSLIAILVYVDNILIMGNDIIRIMTIKEILQNYYELRDLGSWNISLILRLQAPRRGSI